MNRKVTDMPLCELCNCHFPNKMEIDGKVRNLQNRRYCLTCSPFGQHNTRAVLVPGEMIANGKRVFIDRAARRRFVCETCKRHRCEKTRNRTCAACKKSLVRKTNKAKARTLHGGKCVLCGYDRCAGALDFHHIDRNEKLAEISVLANGPWVTLETELQKCILLCCMCHREIENGYPETVVKLEGYLKQRASSALI